MTDEFNAVEYLTLQPNAKAGDIVPCPLCHGAGVTATSAHTPKAVVCRCCDGTRVVTVEVE